MPNNCPGALADQPDALKRGRHDDRRHLSAVRRRRDHDRRVKPVRLRQVAAIGRDAQQTAVCSERVDLSGRDFRSGYVPQFRLAGREVDRRTIGTPEWRVAGATTNPGNEVLVASVERLDPDLRPSRIHREQRDLLSVRRPSEAPSILQRDFPLGSRWCTSLRVHREHPDVETAASLSARKREESSIRRPVVARALVRESRPTLVPLSIEFVDPRIAHRVIGILLIIAGFGYLLIACTFSFIQLHRLQSNIYLMIVAVPGVIGELSLAFWLLFKGVKVQTRRVHK